ncbi:MAG: cytochrome P450 [Actinoallomurus sp.]
MSSRCAIRYESSLSFSTGRTAIEDFEFEGQEIKAGDVVMVSLLAVNRDPQRFEAPDELRFDRTQNAHPGFRPRHPPVHRRATGPLGGDDRVRPATHPLPRTPPRRRSRAVVVATQAPDPRSQRATRTNRARGRPVTRQTARPNVLSLRWIHGTSRNRDPAVRSTTPAPCHGDQNLLRGGNPLGRR